MQTDPNATFTLVLSIISSVVALAGLVISIFSYLHTRIDALNMYFSYDRDPNYGKSREIIYNLTEDQIIAENVDSETRTLVSYTLNMFQHTGLLVRRHQLPFWIFYSRKDGITASGIAVIRTYNKLLPTIKYRRENNNPKYAYYYEYLYNKIVKKCPEYKDYT